MPIKLGLVGLPNAGKSTLFNALTAGDSAIGNYPFTTRERYIGVAAVEDTRLNAVTTVMGSAKATPAQVEVVDIAGLVRGASRGEGLGNQFLAHIREVDMIIHVVKAFEDPAVSDSGDAVDAADAIEVVETELLLADLQTLEKMREKAQTAAKGIRKVHTPQLQLIDDLMDALGRGIPARSFDLGDRPADIICKLLTGKPAFVVTNVNEGTVARDALRLIERHAVEKRYHLESVNARLAHELCLLDPEEQVLFADELESTNVQVIIQQALAQLDMITFFTGNANETRAWLCRSDTPTKLAGGFIHTDIARGFIACEVIQWDCLTAAGSWSKAKDQAMIRVEGGEYLIKDGDVCLFRFNV